MSTTDESSAATATAPGTDSVEGWNGRYQQSTISFPYGSLKDAEQIAKALHEMWGGSASPEQLSGGLNQTPKSGAFRNKTAAARIFGLTETGRGQISLTPLGRRILDPQTRADARVEAFLHVPLFAKLYEDFKSSNLPPDVGLEQKILSYGVGKKQTMKARQVFQRSAELAGFFKHGKGRLIEPQRTSESRAPAKSDHARKEDQAMNPVIATSSRTLPAPVEALWLTLLQDGRSWSAEKTQEFVEAARKLHELLTPQND